MPSMKDVAYLAGVSVSTVSRVINQSVFVDQNTRLKVEKAIRELNYKPNLLAKGLRLKSGNLIGLVVPEFEHNQALVRFVSCAEQSAVKYGFNLILGNNHNNPDDEEKFIDSLIRRHVYGIIFSRVSDESRVLKIIDNTNIPIVVIDRVLDNEDTPRIVLDNYKAGEMAAKYLVDLGHRDIACITGPLNISICRERLKGFNEVLKKHNAKLDHKLVFEGDFRFDSGKDAMIHFLNSGLNITALWAQNDLMAIGAMNILIRKNIDIPEDISIIGMDNIDDTKMLVPSLTTIAQPYGEMCEKAVETIISQKQGKIFNKNIVLQPELIVRETTRELE